MKAKPRVVVLGGGFGGLESAFYLRHKLGEKVALTLVSDRDYFLFKPNTIYIPFGEEPAKLEIPLERPARRKGIELVRGSARIGKKPLGLYLPWRFGAGEPFHAGLAWEAMDLGLKVMSKALAR